MLKKTIAILIVCLVSIIPIQLGTVNADDVIEEDLVPSSIFEEQPAMAVAKVPFIDATAAIVMDMKSGRVMFEKNSRTKKSIASTTKIMTCILAIENGNLEDTVKVSKRAASIWGSTINIKEGQQLKLKELLYGLMLRSGNDAAIAIAEHIGESVEGFAEMMNEKAREIGAENTSFRTPHGLDSEGHYSTAYDLALIARYALKNGTFSKIVGTSNTYALSRQLHNTNEMLGMYPGADGVKTGYTGQAGRCLVTSATRNNWRIISVVLGCPSRAKRALASKNILDYCFANYKPYRILTEGKVVSTIPVKKGISKDVKLYISDGCELPLREDEINSLKSEVDMPDSFIAPVRKSDAAGTIRYILEGQVIARSDLKTSDDIPRKSAIDYFGEILVEWQRTMREGL